MVLVIILAVVVLVGVCSWLFYRHGMSVGYEEGYRNGKVAEVRKLQRLIHERHTKSA